MATIHKSWTEATPDPVPPSLDDDINDVIVQHCGAGSYATHITIYVPEPPPGGPE
jgi:hypothetical protein